MDNIADHDELLSTFETMTGASPDQVSFHYMIQ